jgi:hypothetical protein
MDRSVNPSNDPPVDVKYVFRVTVFASDLKQFAVIPSAFWPTRINVLPEANAPDKVPV